MKQLVPAFLIAIAFDPARKAAIRSIGWMILFGAIGFSVYAFLPIRSAKEPPLNWGQPTTVEKFTRTIPGDLNFNR